MKNFFHRKFQTLALGSVGLLTAVAAAQSSFFHLLPQMSEPSVSFSTSSQTVSETAGTWGEWPGSLSAWSKRRPIALLGAATALTDFPVLVRLNSSRIDYASTRPAGQDLRFADAAGNLLSFEIENWNSSGTSHVWVKVPSLSAAPAVTRIFVYYGNNAASDGQNRSGVWSSQFGGVYHLNGNSNDSSAAANNGTDVGVSYQSGLLNNALSVDGTTGNRVTLPGSLLAKDVFTYSVLFKTTSSGVVLSHANNTYSNTPTSWNPLLYIGTDLKLYGGMNATYGLPEFTSPDIVADGQWHQVVIVADSVPNQHLYLDGQLLGSVWGVVSGTSMTSGYLGMGFWSQRLASGVGWNSFSGQLDFLTVANVNRGSDWIKHSYSTTMDQIATYGPEEGPNSGLATINVQVAPAPGTTVTAPYTISGTAANNSDFILASGTLSFNSGVTLQTLSPRILRDLITESNETLIISLGIPTGAALSSPSVHTLTITDWTNTSPLAANDTFTVTSGKLPLILDVLANDTDANGDPLSLVSATNPSSGTINIVGSRLVYNPNEDFGSSGTFTYTVSDGRGGTSTATVTLNFSVPFTWTGATSTDWNTGSNWVGGVVPGSQDTVYFNNQCSTRCNPVISSALSLGGWRMNTSYTGTIAQPAGVSITIGKSGWIQRAGTFTGSNADITIDTATTSIQPKSRGLTVSGGTFTAPSANLTVNHGDWTISTSATFNHNNGTLNVDCGPGSGCTFSSGSKTYWNLRMTSHQSSWSGNFSIITVSRNLQLGDTAATDRILYYADIRVSGDVTIVGNGYRSGSSAIKLMGNAAGQTLTGSAAFGSLPGLEIVAGTNSVTMVGNIQIHNGDYRVTSVGTLTAPTHLRLHNVANVVSGTANYNTVTFQGNGNTYNLNGSTMNVNGHLYLAEQSYANTPMNNGTINARGDVTVVDRGYAGSALIRVSGSGNQLITGNLIGTLPAVEIVSTGGVISLSGTLKVLGTYTYTSGVLNAGTSTLHFYAYFATQNITPGTVDYFNVRFGGDGGTYNLTGTINVKGTLEIAREGYYKPVLNTGTVLAYGGIYFSGGQNYFSDYYTLGGTHTLKVMGSANQSVTSASGWTAQGWFGGNFEVAKTGGTLTFTGNQAWVFARNFTHTSGSVDFGTSTALFFYNNQTPTITPGSINFNSVTIELTGTTTLTVSGTWQISNTLTLNGVNGSGTTLMNGGTINLSGNFVSQGAGYGGTTALNLTGSTTTDFTYGNQVMGSTIVINKSGGASVRWLSDALLIAGQSMTISAGTANLNGFDLQSDSTITVASGATVTCNNGNLSVATLANSGTINCPGYAGWPYNWTGAGANALWSNAANWAGGIVPGATHVAAFNSNLCGANCNVTIDTTVNVLGLQMKNNYTGTITANAGVAITIGSRGWRQDSGTFNGSSGTIIINGHWRIWAGSFTASSADTRVVGGGITLAAGSTFNHNNGSFRHDTNSGSWDTPPSISLGGKNFNNLSLVGANTTRLMDSANVAGTLTVDKNSYGGALTDGTLNLSGNVNIAKCECGNRGQTATLFNFTGSATQTLSVTATLPQLPRMSINKAGGSLTWSGNFSVISIQHTAGTVNVPANHTLTINSDNGWNGNVAMSPGTIPFENLNFASSGNIVTTGSWSIAKTMTISHNGYYAQFTGGTFKVAGNMTINVLEGAGTTAVLLEGGSNQTLTTASANSRPGGIWTINKPAGTVTLASNLSLSTPGQDLIITAGTLDMAGFNLSVQDNISNNGVLRRGTSPSCGTITSTSLTGTAPICP